MCVTHMRVINHDDRAVPFDQQCRVWRVAQVCTSNDVTVNSRLELKTPHESDEFTNIDGLEPPTRCASPKLDEMRSHRWLTKHSRYEASLDNYSRFVSISRPATPPCPPRPPTPTRRRQPPTPPELPPLVPPVPPRRQPMQPIDPNIETLKKTICELETQAAAKDRALQRQWMVIKQLIEYEQ